LEARFGERLPNVAFKRYSKPTFTKAGRAYLRRQNQGEAASSIEAPRRLEGRAQLQCATTLPVRDPRRRRCHLLRSSSIDRLADVQARAPSVLPDVSASAVPHPIQDATDYEILATADAICVERSSGVDHESTDQ